MSPTVKALLAVLLVVGAVLGVAGGVRVLSAGRGETSGGPVAAGRRRTGALLLMSGAALIVAAAVAVLVLT
ncbi:hypothetical protein [Bailinhaonella thermotolerans]|uniref:Uncharacterized protein n=1 Tax=Bailinhaonella thermotolerans TaxID=1070861 RepID=A0A3A4ADI7_9ACTN|nr:hypothetical protein [Bailinhaonella thermotolerans]RJL24817.1 hypothetical protein D5H75_28990 [Bailinhaonella thermotolerans]